MSCMTIDPFMDESGEVDRAITVCSGWRSAGNCGGKTPFSERLSAENVGYRYAQGRQRARRDERHWQSAFP